MGGFTINGFGAKEYFTKVKYLGDKMCPNCNNTTPFYLEKAKYKVAMLYIPTVTIKERYVIMCERCGRGNYIEDAEA